MPMRRDCKHFESRTYGNGETMRSCHLDLAPDAPWRCPEACPGFERRSDTGWTYGSMVPSATPDEPPGLDDGSAAAVLDEAEDFLRAVGPQVIAELEAERESERALPRRFLRMWRRRFPRGD